MNKRVRWAPSWISGPWRIIAWLELVSGVVNDDGKLLWLSTLW